MGNPIAFYSDKHGGFRTAHPSEKERTFGLTQFGRALYELNIDIICSNTPQAKGRVERANQRLQDRLVKEFRLRGISTVEAANAYAPDFIREFNTRFGKEPRNPKDMHRSRTEDDLTQEHQYVAKIATVANLAFRFQVFKESLTALAGEKKSFFDAAILIFSPFAGLRPSHSGEVLTLNFPSPGQRYLAVACSAADDAFQDAVQNRLGLHFRYVFEFGEDCDEFG